MTMLSHPPDGFDDNELTSLALEIIQDMQLTDKSPTIPMIVPHDSFITSLAEEVEKDFISRTGSSYTDPSIYPHSENPSTCAAKNNSYAETALKIIQDMQLTDKSPTIPMIVSHDSFITSLAEGVEKGFISRTGSSYTDPSIYPHSENPATSAAKNNSYAETAPKIIYRRELTKNDSFNVSLPTIPSLKKTHFTFSMDSFPSPKKSYFKPSLTSLPTIPSSAAKNAHFDFSFDSIGKQTKSVSYSPENQAMSAPRKPILHPLQLNVSWSRTEEIEEHPLSPSTVSISGTSSPLLAESPLTPRVSPSPKSCGVPDFSDVCDEKMEKKTKKVISPITIQKKKKINRSRSAKIVHHQKRRSYSEESETFEEYAVDLGDELVFIKTPDSR